MMYNSYVIYKSFVFSTKYIKKTQKPRDMAKTDSLDGLKKCIETLVNEFITEELMERVKTSSPNQIMGEVIDKSRYLEEKLTNIGLSKLSYLEQEMQERRLNRHVEGVEEFAKIYGKMFLANTLFEHSFSVADNEQTLVLLPHCLTRKGCERYEVKGFEDYYDLCGKCSKCPTESVYNIAEQQGYDPNNCVILGGDDIIPELLEIKDHDAIAGVACPKHVRDFLKGYEKMYDKGMELKPLRIGMLNKGGCKNTGIDLGEVRNVLLKQETEYREPEYQQQQVLVEK